MRDESSPLWLRTLGTNHDEEGERLRLSYLATRNIEALVLKQICEAWECEIDDILEPIEKRGWDDLADIGYEHIGEVPVYRLNRPARRT